jgi:hypothetical protein
MEVSGIENTLARSHASITATIPYPYSISSVIRSWDPPSSHQSSNPDAYFRPQYFTGGAASSTCGLATTVLTAITALGLLCEHTQQLLCEQQVQFRRQHPSSNGMELDDS